MVGGVSKSKLRTKLKPNDGDGETVADDEAVGDRELLILPDAVRVVVPVGDSERDALTDGDNVRVALDENDDERETLTDGDSERDALTDGDADAVSDSVAVWAKVPNDSTAAAGSR